MNIRTTVWLSLLLFVAFSPAAMANGKAHPQAAAEQAATGQAAPGQTAKAPAVKTPPAPSPKASAQKLNIQEYIELMRSNVRDQKAELMGSVMQLNIEDSAKFWPIYSEYDAELSKLNDLRVANIEDYAKNYTQMTDEKADELILKSQEYLKLRGELLAKYYLKMKESLGAITAARFVQVEHQLLLLIDLQIASSLPIVGE
jgi:hypothetical protein